MELGFKIREMPGYYVWRPGAKFGVCSLGTLSKGITDLRTALLRGVKAKMVEELQRYKAVKEGVQEAILACKRGCG